MALLSVVRRAPEQFGYTQSRWSLSRILASCPWLDLETEAGMSRLLDRLHLHYKRGRSYIYSPDPFYEAKLALIETCQAQAYHDPARFAFLYQDEFSFYRQPSLGRDYEAQGHVQPLARWSVHSNTCCRGIGALNAFTGQVTYRQWSKIGLRQLPLFFEAVRMDYPQVEMIFMVVDNWPMHFHPDVLAGLMPQDFPWPPRLSSVWPTHASPRARRADLPIRLLCLPTYASWLNPIEKLWRWARQSILHLHRSSDDWPVLKQRVLSFMAQFEFGSTDLLHYVGLLPY